MTTRRRKPLPPQSYDDRYIRAYRRFLLRQAAAWGDKSEDFYAFLAQPHSYLAYSIYHGPNCDLRYVLEARLLTEESFADIAVRFQIEEESVAHYEALLLPRPRPAAQHALDPRCDIRRMVGRMNGEMSKDQRGFLYRLFGYYGGPDVLDAVIQRVRSATMPECREDVTGWLDNAVDQIVQSRATAAATIPNLDTDSVVYLLELAMGPKRTAKTSKAARKLPRTDFERIAARLIAKLSRSSSKGCRKCQPTTQPPACLHGTPSP